jgi:hypothetical protein
VGEALVSLLQEDGSPSAVERTLIKPPGSRLGPLTPKERAIIQSVSPVEGKYDSTIDRESAEEILKARGEEAAAAAAAEKATAAEAKASAERAKIEARDRAVQAKEQARLERERRANPGIGEDLVRQVGKSVQRQMVNKVAGSLIRGLLGGLFKGR